MAILKVENLIKSYKSGFIPQKQTVLKGISFQIKPGTITGFLGGNGAGKTTTMKCVLGLAFPDSGSIKFFGDNELDSQIKSRIGFLPERPYFYDYLTGYEFLRFYAELSGRFKNLNQINERIDYLLKKVDLLHAKNKALKNYSKGMLQKVGLSQALIHNPEFVILDEPMSGLDPDGRFYLSELIQETARNGTSIFFSSHLMHDTEKLCENLVILKDGVVIYEGQTRSLLQKMNSTSEIKYLSQGQLQTETLDNGKPLQDRINQLIKQNHEIVSIAPNLMSLEQAFIEMAMKDAKK